MSGQKRMARDKRISSVGSCNFNAIQDIYVDTNIELPFKLVVLGFVLDSLLSKVLLLLLLVLSNFVSAVLSLCLMPSLSIIN